MRYFNVYGPNEAHKGRMASVAFHAFNQYLAEGKVKLFDGSGGYGDGEQRRDFVYVDDAVAVNLWFLEQPRRVGHLQLRHRPRADLQRVAAAVINAVRGTQAHAARHASPRALIEYVPFPRSSSASTRAITQADLARLRAAGLPGRVHDGRAGRRRLREGAAGANEKDARRLHRQHAARAAAAPAGPISEQQERDARQARRQQPGRLGEGPARDLA